MDIINGKTGIYVEASRNWRRRLRKYKASRTKLYPSLRSKTNSLNVAQ
jgi:hypothetical protein